MVASISCVNLDEKPRHIHEICNQNTACAKGTYCRYSDNERRTYGTCELAT
ncbi:unnamed protein product [Cunninghamella blakesleeana]